MRQYRDEMQKIVYEVFGDELNEKDSIIENLKNELYAKNLALKSKDELIESWSKEIISKDELIEFANEKISNLTKINKNFVNTIKQLSKISDLNSEAQKIIETILYIEL